MRDKTLVDMNAMLDKMIRLSPEAKSCKERLFRVEEKSVILVEEEWAGGKLYVVFSGNYYIADPDNVRIASEKRVYNDYPPIGSRVDIQDVQSLLFDRSLTEVTSIIYIQEDVLIIYWVWNEGNDGEKQMNMKFGRLYMDQKFVP